MFKGVTYNTDGTSGIFCFGSISFGDDIDFQSGNADEIIKIKHKQYSERFTSLINSLQITYYTMKRLIGLLQKQNFLERDISYFQRLIGYQKNDETAGCLFLLQLADFDYDYKSSFINNIEKMLNTSSQREVHINTADALQKRINENFCDFLDKLKIGNSKFLAITII